MEFTDRLLANQISRDPVCTRWSLINIEKTRHALEDIYQQIYLAKFHENSTLPGRVDSKSADSLSLKLNQLFPVRSDFHKTLKTLQGLFAGEYLKCTESLYIL